MHRIRSRRCSPPHLREAVLVLGAVLTSFSCRSLQPQPPPPSEEPPRAALAPGEQPCGGCHREHVEELALSKKFRAATNPVYAALRARAEREAPDAAARCDQCHEGPRSAGRDAPCLGCHGIAPGLARAWAEPGVIYGARARQGISHPVQMNPDFRSAVLCANCHSSTHNLGEGAFDQWRATDYGHRNVHCIECHMERGEYSRAGHHFPGNDLRWLERGLELTARSASNEALELEVSNGAGHVVPPEACELREVVVEVAFLDAAGKPLSSLEAARYGCQLRNPENILTPHFQPHTKGRDIRLPIEGSVLQVAAPAGWSRATARFVYYPLSRALRRTLRLPPEAAAAVEPQRFGLIEVKAPGSSTGASR